jgi:uncharacterized membrane protein YuzA (DUF378 family)
MDIPKVLETVCLILVLIGAINWGLVGMLNYDLVVAISTRNFQIPNTTTSYNALARSVYILVFVAALGLVFLKYVVNK